jgi:hypothetical protein
VWALVETALWFPSSGGRRLSVHGCGSVHTVVELRKDVRDLHQLTGHYPQQLKEGRYSVRISERGGIAFLSRCSFAQSANRVTCGQYRVDRVAFDPNVRIKKYYIFSSQFDVQVFSDLTFVENNGRGGIAFGRCRLIAP